MTMGRTTIGPLVLAIAPSNRGFGYVILEGAKFLVDWGIKERQPRSNSGIIDQTQKLIEWYGPEVLLIEDGRDEDSRRSLTVKDWLASVTRHGKNQGLVVHCYVRADVRDCFESVGASKKHEIALVVGNYFPELLDHVPPKRKIWQSETSRMSIFDAAALAITHFSMPMIVRSRVSVGRVGKVSVRSSRHVFPDLGNLRA